tara:strand:+ start:477 stop:809 length:333 start_codon:yes stop_codon:yes gene_type:complete
MRGERRITDQEFDHEALQAVARTNELLDEVERSREEWEHGVQLLARLVAVRDTTGSRQYVRYRHLAVQAGGRERQERLADMAVSVEVSVPPDPAFVIILFYHYRSADFPL